MANKNAVANDNQSNVKEGEKMADQQQNNQQVEGSEVKNPPAVDNTQNNQPAPVVAAPEPPKENWFKRNWKKLAAGAGAIAGGALALFAAHQHGVATGFDKASEAYSHLADSYRGGGDDDDTDDEDDQDDIVDGDFTEI